MIIIIVLNAPSLITSSLSAIPPCFCPVHATDMLYTPRKRKASSSLFVQFYLYRNVMHVVHVAKWLNFVHVVEKLKLQK